MKSDFVSAPSPDEAPAAVGGTVATPVAPQSTLLEEVRRVLRNGRGPAAAAPGPVRPPRGGSDERIERIMLVEDSAGYAALVREMLRDALGPELAIDHRSHLADARRALVLEAVDCVLLDLTLPDASGLEALHALGQVANEVPIIVLSGVEDESLAVEAVQSGAQDYLAKRDASSELLRRAIRYAVQRKRAEAELHYLALHDSLTGLPNRTLFLDRLQLAMARSERTPSSVAVLFVDLDRFKLVNDSLGHESGDQLLVEVSERLCSLVRPGDTVARFGGDEFMILCEDVESEDAALAVADRLQAGLACHFALQGQEVVIGASIGIAFGSELEDAHGLIRKADRTMYRAKHLGTRIELFEPAVESRAPSPLRVENELLHALERSELSLVYQPEIDLRTGRVFAVEALLRWNHPVRGLIQPSQFVPVAEASGMIVPIGEWVLREACAQLRRWQGAGGPEAELTMGVNLSSRQLVERGLTAAVAASVADTGISASSLCLELTETSVVTEPARAGAVFEDLMALGVRLTIDDFGTGYSSLSALGQYPIHGFKIDRSLLAEVTERRSQRAMLDAALGVAKALEVQAVAEGVEHPAQVDLLKELGCQAAQGFYFARPVHPEAIPALCAAGAERAG